jgi:hypothetical protein
MWLERKSHVKYIEFNNLLSDLEFGIFLFFNHTEFSTVHAPMIVCSPSTFCAKFDHIPGDRAVFCGGGSLAFSAAVSLATLLASAVNAVCGTSLGSSGTSLLPSIAQSISVFGPASLYNVPHQRIIPECTYIQIIKVFIAIR